jgi:predicted TIM-barrel fold metal-dependent hydrolase
MILDANVLLGRWPFASRRYETVDGVLELMDRAGIDKAAVSSLNSVFYYDCEIGNRQVGEACRRHADRLIPFVVLNPNLMMWREHLCECLEAYDVRGIKLHPDYHKYSLVGGRVAEVMAEARAHQFPVFIQTSLVDTRHHPGYCFVPEVPILEVAQAVERYSENTFIVGGAKHFGSRALELLDAAASGNYYIVTDGLGGPFDGIGELAARIGSDRLLFGTRTPLLYAEAARAVVEQSLLSERDRQNIFCGNALGLFAVGG